MGLLNDRWQLRLSLLRELRIAIFLIIVSLGIGVVGFRLIEHYNWLDSFYMTIITISTVGFSEVRPLSEPGRMFTAFYIISNIGIFTYAVTTIASFVVEGRLANAFHTLRIKRDVDHLRNHTIICGFGRNGLEACVELAAFKQPFVVIESNAERIDLLREQYKFTVLTGDATSDNLLKEAGIEHAKALISTLPGDAENVYVVLTARGLNPKLKIISRASNENAEQKLMRAGADYVVIPEKIGGSYMAHMITLHNKRTLLDSLHKYGGTTYGFKEVELTNLTTQQRKTNLHALANNRTGAMVVGYRKTDGTYVIHPQEEVNLEHASALIILGNEEQTDNLEQFLKQI